MSRRVLLPGSRDVRGSLDEPGSGSDDTGCGPGSEPNAEPGPESEPGPGPGPEPKPEPEPDACIVACPPHPEMGGSRSDRRLRAVSEALVADGIACLRFDYGPFDDGYGERLDARNAVSWAADRYDRVGLFGYSFGGTIALLAAAGRTDLAAVSALAPTARLAPDLDAADALDAIACPVQVVYGERDDAVEWRPVVGRARDLGYAVEAIAGDHHFVGQDERVGRIVAGFLADRL